MLLLLKEVDWLHARHGAGYQLSKDAPPDTLNKSTPNVARLFVGNAEVGRST